MMVSMITVQPYAADCESPSHQQMLMVRLMMLVGMPVGKMTMYPDLPW